MGFRKVQYCTCTVQYSTVQYSTVQYSTVQYSTVQYNTVQYSTVQYSTLQYNTVQYSTVQYSTVQYSTSVHCAVLCTLHIQLFCLNCEPLEYKCYSIATPSVQLILSSQLYLFMMSNVGENQEVKNKFLVSL